MSLEAAFATMFAPISKRSAGTGAGQSYFNEFFSLLSPIGLNASAVNYRTSLKLSAVYNAVDQISNDIAKIPFNVYQKINDKRTILDKHPANILVSREPNKFMTSFIERKMMVTSLLLRGNALSIINFDNVGKPVSTTYVHWDLVTDIKIANGDLVYYISGFAKPFLSSEVLHFKNFTHNGIVGISVITYAAQQLNMALSVQDFSATNYENKGVRQGVIQTDKQVNPEAKLKIITGYKNAMAEKSADRVTVLDDGMKFSPITITPQELQIIEQSKFNTEDIARWFNIAPHKIKSMTQTSHNTIEQQTLDHVSDTIQPHVTNFEQEYSKKLLTQKERETTTIVGDMDVLLRADIKSRAEWYTKMIFSGVWSRNEVRRKENMNDGPAMLDEFLTPVNTFTEDQLKNNLNPPA